MTLMRGVAFCAALIAAGCSTNLFNRDREALDKFSRAYRIFLVDGEYFDAAFLSYFGPENDASGFWLAFKQSLTTEGDCTDCRLAMAQTAIAVFDQTMPAALSAGADQAGRLDKAVEQLFETASAIHNSEYRGDAVQIARHAREAQESFVQGHTLSDQEAQLERQSLNDIVSTGGNLVRAFKETPLKERMAETVKIHQERETVSKESTSAMHKLKDTFSTLKGKTNLTVYPIERESEKSTPGRASP